MEGLAGRIRRVAEGGYQMRSATEQIRFVDHHQLDFQKWDACIQQSVNSLAYAQSWYLNLVADRWGALIEGDYRAVMPLPYRTHLGIKYVYQPFFIQQLGLFSAASLNRERVESFLQALPREFRWIDMNLNTFNKVKSLKGLLIEQRITYELDLLPSYTALKAGFTENTLRNIRKAEKAGIFISEQGKPDEIINSFRQFRGKQLDVFGERHYRTLSRLIYEGLQKGVITMLHAYSQENNFCAGIVFLRNHHKTIFLFSGATPEARENGAMFMLVDHFVRTHAGQKLILDFEGSSQAGLARFYSGFGSKECVFLRIKINRLPILLKPLAGVYHWLRKRKNGET
jgi:hypothetical protein